MTLHIPKNSRLIEYSLYLFVLGIMLLFYIFDTQDIAEYSDVPWWKFTLRHWIKLTPFVLVFLINNFVLYPKLGRKSNMRLYVCCAILLSIVVCLLWISAFKPFMTFVFGDNSWIYQHRCLHSQPRNPLFFFPGKFIICLLVIGFNTAVKQFFQLRSEHEREKEMEKAKLELELKYLQQQINPHFLMNTLNNIHALIDINKEDAKDAVIQLSNLMRYSLYETSQPVVDLKKTIVGLENYFQLIRKRYPEKIDIRINLPEQIPSVSVPPFVFITFVENAFKHGISYQRPSYIYFTLKVENNKIVCIVENSKHPSATSAANKKGIGLINIKKRLDILFGNNYTLDINDAETFYKITLQIPAL